MAILQYVEVKVVLSQTEQQLLEYDDPKAEAESSDYSVKKYVEVPYEAEFKVVVTLKAGFDYHLAFGVFVKLSLDGDVLRDSKFHWNAVTERDCWWRPIQEDIIYELDKSTIARCGGWREISYAFGSISVGQSSSALQ